MLCTETISEVSPCEFCKAVEYEITPKPMLVVCIDTIIILLFESHSFRFFIWEILGEIVT